MNDTHRQMVSRGDFRMVVVVSEGELRSLCRALDLCRFYVSEAFADEPCDITQEECKLLGGLDSLQVRLEAKLEKVGGLRLKARREIQAQEAFVLYDMGEGKAEKVTDWRWDGNVASCGFVTEQTRRLFVVRFAEGESDVIDQQVLG